MKIDKNNPGTPSLSSAAAKALWGTSIILACCAMIVATNGLSKHRDNKVSGVMSPGNSPGCFESSGNLTYSSTSTLIVEIGGLDRCSTYDQVTAAGTITINNASLQIALFGSFVPSVGDSFQVLSAAEFAGPGFVSIDFSAAILPPGSTWDASEVASSGVLRVVVDETVNQVPLPPLALVILAFAIAYAGRRKNC